MVPVSFRKLTERHAEPAEDHVQEAEIRRVDPAPDGGGEECRQDDRQEERAAEEVGPAPVEAVDQQREAERHEDAERHGDGDIGQRGCASRSPKSREATMLLVVGEADEARGGSSRSSRGSCRRGRSGSDRGRTTAKRNMNGAPSGSAAVLLRRTWTAPVRACGRSRPATGGPKGGASAAGQAVVELARPAPWRLPPALSSPSATAAAMSVTVEL